MSIDVGPGRQFLETSRIAVNIKREPGVWIVLVEDGEYKMRELPYPSSVPTLRCYIPRVGATILILS